jgi:hypothetical protein
MTAAEAKGIENRAWNRAGRDFTLAGHIATQCYQNTRRTKMIWAMNPRSQPRGCQIDTVVRGIGCGQYS